MSVFESIEPPRPGLGLWSATALVVGHTIAIGIFLTPAELIGAVASPVLTLAMWVACGALILAGAFTFGELAARYPLARALVIEFVPKEDSQVQRMLASRKEVLEDYSQEAFVQACARQFDVEHVTPVRDSARTIYIMRRRLQAGA